MAGVLVIAAELGFHVAAVSHDVLYACVIWSERCIQVLKGSEMASMFASPSRNGWSPVHQQSLSPSAAFTLCKLAATRGLRHLIKSLRCSSSAGDLRDRRASWVVHVQMQVACPHLGIIAGWENRRMQAVSSVTYNQPMSPSQGVAAGAYVRRRHKRNQQPWQSVLDSTCLPTVRSCMLLTISRTARTCLGVSKLLLLDRADHTIVLCMQDPFFRR